MTELNVWQYVDDYFMTKLLSENEHLNTALQANKAQVFQRLMYLLLKGDYYIYSQNEKCGKYFRDRHTWRL